MNNTCKSYTPSRSWSQRSRSPYNSTLPTHALHVNTIYSQCSLVRRPSHHRLFSELITYSVQRSGKVAIPNCRYAWLLEQMIQTLHC